jgi:hypothetical protein
MSTIKELKYEDKENEDMSVVSSNQSQLEATPMVD